MKALSHKMVWPHKYSNQLNNVVAKIPNKYDDVYFNLRQQINEDDDFAIEDWMVGITE